MPYLVLLSALFLLSSDAAFTGTLSLDTASVTIGGVTLAGTTLHGECENVLMSNNHVSGTNCDAFQLDFDIGDNTKPNGTISYKHQVTGSGNASAPYIITTSPNTVCSLTQSAPFFGIKCVPAFNPLQFRRYILNLFATPSC